MSNKENRKGVYFSKTNQDLKEYVEENVFDFTAYVMNLIRRDMNGELDQIKVINQNLKQVTLAIDTLKEEVSALKNQSSNPAFQPMYYAPQMMPQQMMPQPIVPHQISTSTEVLLSEETTTSKPKKPKSSSEKRKHFKTAMTFNEEE